MRVDRTYERWAAIAISIICAACSNPHVNGTTVAPDEPCEGRWTAIVTNTTARVYDLYIGTRLVGTADANSTTRTVIDPQFGKVTPSLRESATTRDQTGPRLRPGAVRMVCE